MPQTEYKKQWYIKNKEKILQKRKEYYETHKEEKKLYGIQYYIYNKEKLSEHKKLYRKTEKSKNLERISKWKQRGLLDHFNDNYETICRIYLSTKFCDDCGFELNIEGDNRTRKCMDHCHKSGYFRNILCSNCNIRRG